MPRVLGVSGIAEIFVSDDFTADQIIGSTFPYHSFIFFNRRLFAHVGVTMAA
jgi:hypothetical protein